MEGGSSTNLCFKQNATISAHHREIIEYCSKKWNEFITEFDSLSPERTTSFTQTRQLHLLNNGNGPSRSQKYPSQPMPLATHQFDGICTSGDSPVACDPTSHTNTSYSYQSTGPGHQSYNPSGYHHNNGGNRWSSQGNRGAYQYNNASTHQYNNRRTQSGYGSGQSKGQNKKSSYNRDNRNPSSGGYEHNPHYDSNTVPRGNSPPSPSLKGRGKYLSASSRHSSQDKGDSRSMSGSYCTPESTVSPLATPSPPSPSMHSAMVLPTAISE